MVLRLVLWNLSDSKTNIGELRRYLRDESVDEFVVRVLEKEVQKILPPDEGSAPSKELVRKRLQGLGYIE